MELLGGRLLDISKQTFQSYSQETTPTRLPKHDLNKGITNRQAHVGNMSWGPSLDREPQLRHENTEERRSRLPQGRTLRLTL